MGSGNAGATNVLRNMGLKYAIPTFVGDALKAMLAAVLGCLIIGEGFFEFDWLYGYTCPQIFVGGFAAILGHNFPVFMGFKGGKGVSCSLGLLIVMNPLLGITLVILAAAANLFIKLYSLVSIATMLLATFLYAFGCRRRYDRDLRPDCHVAFNAIYAPAEYSPFDKGTGE